MSQHLLPETALAIASLGPHDPEYVRARAHAASCVGCRALLDEGESLLRLIDGSAGPAVIDGALKAKVRMAVHAPPRDVRIRAWERWLLALPVLISLVLTIHDGQGAGSLVWVIGLECLALEAAAALGMFALTAYFATRGVRELRALPIAVAGAGGALIGQLFLRAHCPAHDALAHLALFHFTGVLFAALLAYLAAERMRVLRAS